LQPFDLPLVVSSIVNVKVMGDNCHGCLCITNVVMFVHILLSKELSANLWVILNEIDNVHIGAIALF
jgi:hypothetical protein